jgi:hypothetical protein
MDSDRVRHAPASRPVWAKRKAPPQHAATGLPF